MSARHAVTHEPVTARPRPDVRPALELGLPRGNDRHQVVAPVRAHRLAVPAAAVLLAAIAVVTRAPWPRTRKAWRDLVITGVLLQGVQFGAAYGALGFGVPAGLGALVLCLAPALVAVFSGPVLGERLGRAGWWGSGAGAGGHARRGRAPPRGGAAARRRASACSCSGWPGSRRARSTRSAPAPPWTCAPARPSSSSQAPSRCCRSPCSPSTGLPLPSTGSGWAALVWIIVVNSIAGAILLFVLLRRGTGAGASGLLYLVPAVTAVLAVPVLGQPLELATIVGLALTLAGVVLVNRAAQPRCCRQRFDLRGGQLQLQHGQQTRELLGGARARDGGRDRRRGGQPGQRDRGLGDVVGRGHLVQRGEHRAARGRRGRRGRPRRGGCRPRRRPAGTCR